MREKCHGTPEGDEKTGRNLCECDENTPVIQRSPQVCQDIMQRNQTFFAMNASTAYSAESPGVQEILNWPEFLLIGLAVLTLVILAIIAPRRRGRILMVTDVLR